MIAVCGPFFFSLCTSLVSAWACEGVLCREVVVGRPTTLAESSHRLQEPPSFDRVPIAAAHTSADTLGARYGETSLYCTLLRLSTLPRNVIGRSLRSAAGSRTKVISAITADARYAQAQTVHNMRTIVLVSLLLSLACAGLSLRRRQLGLRPPSVPPGARVPQPQWFKTQKLDHFSSSDKRTWEQRYFVNDTFWDEKSGPVFLMLGGEGPADPNWLAIDTDIMRNAAKYKAIVIYLEHRYYGESHPTPNASLSNLLYLSSRQALRDAVTFKEYFMTQHNLTDLNKWISFGGSYSGALSGWLRMYYPDTVAGAVATSGPVQAVLNFYQYLEVVTQSLMTPENGPQCVEAIRNATLILDTMLADMSQWQAVEKMFHVSPPLQNQDDVSLLAGTLAGNFMGIVQYNRDNTAFEGRSNNITITDLCDIMANTSLGAPLERYAAVNMLLLQSSGEDVVSANFSATVEFMKQVSWDSPAVMFGERTWIYQTCTEFGYYQTSDSALQVFGDLITLSSQLKTCSAVYGISASAVNEAVTATNKLYGGKDNIPKNATNIVFPNGSIDPWHALGVVQSRSSLVSVFINGTAHCANMYPPSPQDLPALVQAREVISDKIQSWLK